MLINGRLVEEDEARVSVFDRGFLFGDGIFETMRALGGVVFRLQRHLHRLARAAERVGLPPDAAPGSLPQDVARILENNRLSEARIRITVTRGEGRPGDYVEASGPPTIVIYASEFRPLEAERYEHGVTLAVTATRQIPPTVLDPAIKSISRLSNVLARREASSRGAFEALLLDADGRLTEGTVSNVFLVEDGRLRTPPVPAAGLPGVTREAVIEIARGQGLEVREEPIAATALAAADEMFLTNTSWEVLPVTRVDARAIGAGRRGPVTALLGRLYSGLMRRECGVG